ncbi:hypothetical protein [Burkholderia metallica]|uniref:hypothetical protein n=1 Tax=Burkholderia metallica TaxID=488729 RepID=UPI00157547FF|nr:hypothetical protein [Burkholderia metallica]
MYQEDGGSGDSSGWPLPSISVAAFLFCVERVKPLLFELHSHGIAGIAHRQLKEEINDD